MSVVILLGVLTIVSFIYFRYLRAYLEKRSHMIELGDRFAGLPSVPVLGNAHQLPRTSVFDYVDFFLKMTNEYAAKGEDAVRVWVANKLFVVPLNGKTVKDVVDNTVELTKGSDYDFIIPWLGTGLLISTDDKWRSRRKMLTPTFHFAMLDGYLEAFNNQSQILNKQLKKFANNDTVDLFPYIKRCALDIICDTAMGLTVRAQENHTHPYVLAVSEMNRLLFIYATQPWFEFSPLWYAAGYGQSRDRTLKTLTDFTKNVITDRKEARKRGEKKEGKGGRPAFLDQLLDFHDQGLLNEEDVREEVDTFMFEGHDTTSSGIGFVLWCLASHPEIQDKVAAELYGIYGESDRGVTVEDLTQMKYLEMCVKESMRLYPPVPFVQRAVVHGDLKLGDKLIPKGAICSISPIVIHHNATLNPDCEIYNPDNFLPENTTGRHPYDYIPFSAGPRNCIGQKFAMNEEKTMISWILRRYKLEATLPFKKNRVGTWATLIPEFGFPIRLTKRAHA